MADLGIEENAADRKFGPEFDDIVILSNAQVAVILQLGAGKAVTRDEELNDVYRKTQKYVERFNQMANKEKEHQGKTKFSSSSVGVSSIRFGDVVWCVCW